MDTYYVTFLSTNRTDTIQAQTLKIHDAGILFMEGQSLVAYYPLGSVAIVKAQEAPQEGTDESPLDTPAEV